MRLNSVSSMNRYVPIAIVVAVFVTAMTFGAMLFRIKRDQAVAASLAAASAASKKPGNEAGAQPPHVRGSDNATVTLEEFGDFECPPCGELSPILEKIEQDYGSRLRVVFRQYPLPIHKHAREAARASEAAGRQGRFWEMHDLLYHNRFTWPRETDVGKTFDEYAKSLGLDLTRFQKDREGEEVRARIDADRRRAAVMGVDRTPALFVNDRRVPVTSFLPDGLHAVIDVALEEKNKAAKDRP